MSTPGPRAWVGPAVGMFAVAWGSNQFVSLLPPYRAQPESAGAIGDGLFGIYAVSLIIALLLTGPAADLWGHGRVVRPAVALSAVATIAMMVGHETVGLLFAGRFLAGVASGSILAAGTTWVKDLSTPATGADEDAGARRAAISLSLGFGLGPLATGFLALWLPDPLITAYVPHLVLVAVAGALLWCTRGNPLPTRARVARGEFRRRLRIRSARHPRFLRVVLPAAVWVFAGPSIAFAVLPSLVVDQSDGWGTVLTGVTAFLTLGMGVVVQPVARRLDRPGRVVASVVGLLTMALGFGVAALAAASSGPWLVLLCSVPLGTGYGIVLVSGLLETQRIAGPDGLAGLTAVYYALTYAGFALPLLLALLAPVAGYSLMIGVVALLVVVSAAVVGLGARTPVQTHREQTVGSSV